MRKYYRNEVLVSSADSFISLLVIIQYSETQSNVSFNKTKPIGQVREFYVMYKYDIYIFIYREL